MELDNLSMNPQAAPRVKNLIRRSRIDECRAYLARALQLGTAGEIGEMLHAMVAKKFPEELKYFELTARVAQSADLWATVGKQ
jgi:phosphotransferase system enzyme I (PtsI)